MDEANHFIRCEAFESSDDKSAIEHPNLGRGANGVVFDAHHKLLNKPRALKVWLNLRTSDERDKVAQGIAEAQKLAAADPKWVAIIYDAEVADGFFYSSMEKIEGETLKSALKKNPSKLDRWWLARLYMNAISHTTNEEDAHGDPHPGNVMVFHYQENKYDGGTRLKLLDFGTSMFSGPVFSRDRHWKIVGETFRLIVRPLNHLEWALDQAIPFEGREAFIKAAYFDDVLDGLKPEVGVYPWPLLE